MPDREATAGGRVDVELVRRGLVRSRGQAAIAVEEGRVSIDGRLVRKPSERVPAGASLAVGDRDPYVARSAHKLLAALDAFGVDPAGRLALDVGASTGGFTQVLLERGAREVIAFDVGHGQLVPELRADPRVRPVERANARELDATRLAVAAGTPERPSLVVVDVSFISLRTVLPALRAAASPAAEFVALIKPQFEVGRTAVGQGIVRDRAARHAAVAAVLGDAGTLGLAVAGVISSPMLGSAGNREYLAHLRGAGGDPGDDPTEWERALDALD